MMRKNQMAKYTRAKNIDDHLSAVLDFEANIPRNRKTWQPPQGYRLEFDTKRKTRKHLYSDDVSRVGTVSDGDRCIAKATSQWHDPSKTGGQYMVFITTLWEKAKRDDD
jgi:hypothetical protein